MGVQNLHLPRMKFACLFVCLALASATNALPADFFKHGGYVNLAAAQTSAEEIAKAGAGLDVLEGLLEDSTLQQQTTPSNMLSTMLKRWQHRMIMTRSLTVSEEPVETLNCMGAN